MIIRILLFPVILLLVLYFIIAQVVPTAQSISAIKEEIKQQEKLLETAKGHLARVEAFQADIDNHTTEKEYVLDFVPNDQREEILLSDIPQLAEESGVSLFSIGFSEGRQDVRSGAATDGRPHLIEGKVIASGTYEDFKKFTHQLFRIKRLYGFKTFDLTKSEQEKDEDAEGEGVQQDLILSGVISFTYAYVPGAGELSPTSIGKEIDYDLINTVMETTSQTEPLVSEPANRSNPFLP